ncbi:CHASE2 domain-containing protein [Halomonas halocynthiae]|uniref:CHASE2 domain-containing protein n=1 Tax=Halomonas halocynthiae TaxID=176290 RepID=UPI0006859D95|nr:CHASE2 domain-containing protein [Halomonas halocynthiae]
MPRLAASSTRRYARTCFLIALLLVPLTWWLQYERFWASDKLLYDTLVSWRSDPVSSDVLIVAIDELSLESLGAWPWPRNIHAQLLDRLTDADAKAVLMDVFFTEPARHSVEDKQLTEAIERNGNVFLPVLRLHGAGMRGSVLPPLPELRDVARGLGHVSVETDTDGMVRRLYLNVKSAGESWNQLAWQLYQTLQEETEEPLTTLPKVLQPLSRSDNANWQSDQVVRVPYRGPPGSYSSVPYISVLRGEVPDVLLRDRVIMVGATAGGLGDKHPVSLAFTQGSMPGVEVQANLFDALRDGRFIVNVPEKVAAGLGLLPLLGMVLILWLLRFRYLMLPAILALLATLLASWLLMTQGWWWPPSISMLSIVAAYLLISWRSQAEALNWFKKEIEQLEREPHLFPVVDAEPPPNWGDALHRRLYALDTGVERLRSARRFVSDSLKSLPLPLLVVADDGRVILANRLARELEHQQLGRRCENICEFLETLDDNILAGSDGNSLGSALGGAHGRRVYGVAERCYRLDFAPLRTSRLTRQNGWLIGLVDLTAENQAEEQRARMLRFLSHDLKSPQTGLLALVDLQRKPQTALPDEAFYQRIEQQVRTGLSLTEDFMQLAKIEFGAPVMDVVVLEDVVMEVLDQVWAAARIKRIKLNSALECEEGGIVRGDRGYLVRALHNVLENAVKYSPVDTEITVTVKEEAERVICQICDQGRGIAEADLPYIFESYSRVNVDAEVQGHGLGLALVKAVIDQHRGDISCTSTLGEGTCFTLTFIRDNELLE